MIDSIPESLRDTIFVLLPDTVSQSDMIEAYQDLLQSQHQIYNLIVIVLLAILGSLVATTIWWNYRGAKTEIRKLFNSQKGGMIDNLKESFEKKFIELEADIRYIHIHQMKITEIKHYVERINFEVEGIDRCISGGIEGGLRNFADYLLKDLQHLIGHPSEMENYVKQIKKNVEVHLKPEYSINHIKQIINKIPEVLYPEKNKILESLNKIEEEQKKTKE